MLKDIFKVKNEYNYFGAFSKFADYACQTAEMVCGIVKDFDPSRLEEQRKEVHKIENLADELKHEVTERLAKEFIAPIEREDIVTLLRELDNVVDAIDEIPACMFMYNVKNMRAEAGQMAELTVKSCYALKSVMAQFSDFRRSKSIGENIVLVNSLETEGDTLNANALRDLFANENNAVEIMIWRDIYDAFEKCLDCCEHVADVVEEVIMKNC
ncbi:MAG: DUF47 family protein [Clostridia bacterium]|nr:DUF47 family protein [Clostridia bacterium]